MRMYFLLIGMLSSTPLSARANMTPLLDQLLAIYNRPEKIKIKDVHTVEWSLHTIVSGGPPELQVITDYDATLTRSHLNGKKCESSYGVIVNSAFVSSKVRKDIWDLYDEYAPVEFSVSMTVEEKTPYMIEWYEKTHACFLANSPRLTKFQIAEMANNEGIVARGNTHKLLETLHSQSIPVLILSAGMGNLVEEFLKINSINFPNVKVMANFMEFDDKGDLKGFSEPTIHVYNKNHAALHDDNTGYFEELKKRHNVILLGDSLGDTNMANGVRDASAVLKIGFLNDQVSDRLEKYMESFDVVLIDDQSMDFVNALLDLVISKEETFHKTDDEL